MLIDKTIKENLAPLFDPKSVAVIGASNKWNKWGFSTFASIINSFKGACYPVNATEKEVLGHKAYPRVTDIPVDEPVDLAVFVIPPEAVLPVMEDCVSAGVRAGVIITAGFAETGPEGKRLQDQVLAVARKGALHFIGPNCMGFWSASCNLKAFMFPFPVLEGPIAFVSQGGNVGGAVVRLGYDRGLGFYRYVSCGCTADIQIEDYIEYFGADPNVKVIFAYVEGLGDGNRFIDKVRRVTEKKPVIALKPGRSVPGCKAISSHSGALAGSSDLYDCAFRKAGVVRVDTAEALLDLGFAFIKQPLPRGRNVGIITPGGSYGVISADACASAGLNVIELPPETIDQFDRIFPPRWSRGNPVDPAGDRNFIAYMQAPDLLLKLPEVHSLIFMGFDSFSSFSSFFPALNKDLARELGKHVREFSSMIPEGVDDNNGNSDRKWVGQVVGRIASVFFSFFGTSSPSEVAAFGRTQAKFLESGNIGGRMEKKLLQVLKSGDSEDLEKIGGLFAEILQPLMEVLVDTWIENYQKPVLTTSFVGTAPKISDLGHYPYPFAEQAAGVLAKMVEYREYLDRVEAFQERKP
ncbi:MAG: hypothetical protein C4582_00330 [Desulfobacteraceae bacterium]|nr:MAG: hypothetical protein C4582_00330 [Desulfobacteraceae bacterium]